MLQDMTGKRRIKARENDQGSGWHISEFFGKPKYDAWFF